MRRLFASLWLAGALTVFVAGHRAGSAHAASGSPCFSQGVAFHQIVRERERFTPRLRPVECIPSAARLEEAQVVWGDGTSRSVNVSLAPEGSGQRSVLHSRLTHSYDAANCPAARRLLDRCGQGYRMVLVLTVEVPAGGEGVKTEQIEAEPVNVYVLAAADRVSIGAVRNVGGEQEVEGRIVCGGLRHARDLEMVVHWGASRETRVYLHGTARTFVFGVRHLRRGKGPRFVTVSVRDRLAVSRFSATRTLRG